MPATAQSWMIRQTPAGTHSYRAVAGDADECLVVGSDGVVLSRKAGSPWRPEGGSGADLNDIVRGPNGFVAVGSSGRVIQFLRTASENGQRNSSVVGNGTTLNGIAWNGSRFMIVGNNGVSYRSSGASPTSWSPVATGTTKHLHGIGWTGSYWVAVGQDGTILRATSAGAWSTQISPTSDDLRQIASGGGTVTAVGERGVVVTSTSAASSWTRRQFSHLYDWWDVTWDGANFLASADFGLVYRSANGSSWVRETRGVGADLLGIAMVEGTAVAVGNDTVAERQDFEWTRVAGNPEADGAIQRLNGRFVMPGVGGTLAFSDDGQRWAEVAVQAQPSVLVSATTPHWKGLLWTGHRYLAAGPNYLYASNDGTHWLTTTPYSVVGQYRGLGWNGSLAVAVGGNGLLQTSADGLTWTTRPTGPAEEDFSDVVWTGTRWVAVGTYRIFSSEDGITWTEQHSVYPQFLRKLAWTGSQAVVTSSTGILRSPDGLTWSEVTLNSGPFPSMGNLHPSGNRWYAYAFSVTLTPELFASDDGGLQWQRVPFVEPGELVDPIPNHQISRLGSTLWGFQGTSAIPLGDATPRSRDIHDLHWDGSQLIAVGSQGTIRHSTDGITWHWHGTSAKQTLFSVTKSADTWVAVGMLGCIVRSDNGRDWEVATSGTPENLNGVTWNGSRFVAVGTHGTLLTSADGRSWETQNSGVSVPLLAVASNGSQVVATGISGTVLTSPDGLKWAPAPSAPALTSLNLRWLLWTGSRFVAQGIQSEDGLVWQRTPESPPTANACAWNGHEFLLGAASLWRSNDLKNYSGEFNPGPRPVQAIEWIGDRWVIAGSAGFIATSGSYSNWQETEGIPRWKQVQGGDVNEDGVSDLLAFASGLPAQALLTPTQRESLPTLVWSRLHSRWEFRFTRLTTLPPALSYHLEVSEDLRTWTHLGSLAKGQAWPEHLEISETSPLTAVTQNVTLPIRALSPTQFWRLRVEQ
jgi:hypothetical protein